MTTKAIDFYISVGTGADTDPEELYLLSRELGEALFELDSVQSVAPVIIDEPPAGAKGPPVVDIGTILVTMAQAGAISALITVLGSWLARDKSRTLELTVGGNTLKLTGLSKEKQQELLEWFQTQAGLQLDR